MSEWSWEPLVSTTGGGAAVAARKQRVQRYIDAKATKEGKPVIDQLDGTLHDHHHGNTSYSYDVSRSSSCVAHTLSQLRAAPLPPQVCVGANPPPISTAASLLDERASPQQTSGSSPFAQRTCDAYGSRSAMLNEGAIPRNEGAIPRAISSQGNLRQMSAADATACSPQWPTQQQLSSMPGPYPQFMNAGDLPLPALPTDMQFPPVALSPLNPLNQHLRMSTPGVPQQQPVAESSFDSRNNFESVCAPVPSAPLPQDTASPSPAQSRDFRQGRNQSPSPCAAAATSSAQPQQPFVPSPFDSEDVSLNNFPPSQCRPNPGQSMSKQQRMARKNTTPIKENGRTVHQMLSSSSAVSEDRLKAQEHGYPLGPIFGDEDALLRSVKQFCSDVNTHGGGWGAACSGSRKANTDRGKQVRIGCSKYRTELCRWQLAYELTSEGAWYLYSCFFPGTFSGHSHALHHDVASVRAHRNGQFIPVELASLACDSAQGASASTVHAILKQKAKTLGLPCTWDISFIYDTYIRDRSPGVYDMSDMIEGLAARKEEGLASYVKTIASEEDNHLILDRVFIEMEGALQEYARGGDDNVVLFDPTANTNKYKMKLCPFVTVGSSGHTVILAIALLNIEDTAHILWSFECFHAVFKVKPAILVTDEGAPILAAFDAFSQRPGFGWDGVFHRLCIFHLSKNFWNHVSPLVNDRAKFHQLTNLFWKICKQTDADSRDNFDTEWGDFVDQVESASTNGKRWDVTKAWLLDMKAKSSKFVYRFTWTTCTYLINSTVRSEAINSAVKSRAAHANMRVTPLLQNLDEYNYESRQKKAADAVRLALRQLQTASALPFWVRVPYCVDH